MPGIYYLALLMILYDIAVLSEFSNSRHIVQLLCKNLSLTLSNNSLDNLKNGKDHMDNVFQTLLSSNSSDSPENTRLRDKDRHALLYIVVVLLFYSTGIVIGIIKYLKREKKEIEEEKSYDDYMNFRNDPDKWVRYFGVQRMISQLNRIEAEADKRRREEERQQEELLKRRLAEHKKKPWIFGHLAERRQSRSHKKRFSLAENATHSLVCETEFTDKKKGRRWSLRPALYFNRNKQHHHNPRHEVVEKGVKSGSVSQAFDKTVYSEESTDGSDSACQTLPTPTVSLHIHSAVGGIHHTQSMTEMPEGPERSIAMTDL